MTEFLGAHLSELISAIVGAIAGATISVPITIRLTRNSVSGSVNQVNQSGARAGGDVVGLNKNGR